MDEASDEEVRELLNDALHASNGPRSEEISTNYLFPEQLRMHQILQSLVQEDSDGYGEDDRNVLFEYNSEGEVKNASDEGSGEENLQFSKNIFKGAMAALPAFWFLPRLWPIRMQLFRAALQPKHLGEL